MNFKNYIKRIKRERNLAIKALRQVKAERLDPDSCEHGEGTDTPSDPSCVVCSVRDALALIDSHAVPPETEYGRHVVVELTDLIRHDIDWLNDYVSEQITGDPSALEGIDYEAVKVRKGRITLLVRYSGDGIIDPDSEADNAGQDEADAVRGSCDPGHAVGLSGL